MVTASKNETPKDETPKEGEKAPEAAEQAKSAEKKLKSAHPAPQEIADALPEGIFGGPATIDNPPKANASAK